MDVGPAELLIVLIIVLVVFGGAKLPKLARSIGEAQREFKRGSEGHKDDEPEAPKPVAEESAPAAKDTDQPAA